MKEHACKLPWDSSSCSLSVLELRCTLSNSRSTCSRVIEVEVSKDEGRLPIERLETLNDPLDDEYLFSRLTANSHSPERSLPCKADRLWSGASGRLESPLQT